MPFLYLDVEKKVTPDQGFSHSDVHQNLPGGSLSLQCQAQLRPSETEPWGTEPHRIPTEAGLPL